jgi:N-acetylmuramoyl-L-alanine amidase
LKIGRVVIDAGHGGHDTGMIGPNGLREKDVVLDIALELGRLVEQKLGAEVIYTRSDDTYLKPSARTKVANEAKADLFISVHANASSVRSVRGIETYYLNLTTDAWAMKVASRENAASDHSVHELRDLLGKIAQQDRVAESREFATRMQAAVFSGLTKSTAGLRNRGVRQAPLIVLIGAQMPAILAEVGFLSNPTDEKLFQDKAYRRQVAEHLYDGVASYMGTLSNNQLTMSEEPRASAVRQDD